MNCARVKDGALEGIFCHRARRFTRLKGMALIGGLVLLASGIVSSGAFETMFRAILR